jgi:predicted aminopeptidase
MSECDCCGYDGTDLPRYRGMMQDVLDNLVKKRTAELEAREEANRAHHVAQIAANDRLLLRIAELEERLWVAYQNSGTPNDYDTWFAALLGGGDE